MEDDVVTVGEIRDRETAEIARDTALTGHPGAVHDWINVGSRCGELRLIKRFLLYFPPHPNCVSATFRRPPGHIRDTVRSAQRASRASRNEKMTASERWG